MPQIVTIQKGGIIDNKICSSTRVDPETFFFYLFQIYFNLENNKKRSAKTS